MGNAIRKSGRSILLSLSYGGSQVTDQLIKRVERDAEMYRLTGDMWDIWDSLTSHFDILARFVHLAKTDVWPDADMLPLGRIGGKLNYNTTYGPGF